jgi:hypothetical protein
MTESTQEQFARLARNLLDRDGRDMGDTTGEELITRGVQIDGGKLRIFIDGGFMKANIPSNLERMLPGFRCFIYDEEEKEYATAQMYEWIPKLQKYFVLERLADA